MLTYISQTSNNFRMRFVNFGKAQLVALATRFQHFLFIRRWYLQLIFDQLLLFQLFKNLLVAMISQLSEAVNVFLSLVKRFADLNKF